MAQSEYSISALEAAFDVAESFLTPNGTIRGVSEISRQTGLHKNRVFRILNTLTNRGYIEQDKETQKYRLGSGFLVLGEAYRTGLDLRNAAIPFMQELASESGDAAHLFVLSEERALCVDVQLGSHVVQAPARVGDRLGLNVGAAPKILLTYQPEPGRSNLLREMEYPQYSSKTITDRIELEKALEQIQAQNYSVAEGDYDLSAYAIGAPLRDHTGQVVAAISVVIPQGRYNQELKHEKLKLVLDVALRLSEKLGYRGDSDLQTME